MKYLSGGNRFDDNVREASDEVLQFNLDLHLRHIRNEPNNSWWSLPASAIIQAELDRRNLVTPTEPIADFIWEQRDHSGRE